MMKEKTMKGESVMYGEFGRYEEEVRGKWGETAAYNEYREKTGHYSKEQRDGIAKGMDAIFDEFALYMKKGEAPDALGTQILVKKLQEYITGNYYFCTNEILAGLGRMYVEDQRFRTHIDRHGEGTAAFVSRAIAVCCK